MCMFVHVHIDLNYNMEKRNANVFTGMLFRDEKMISIHWYVLFKDIWTEIWRIL